MPPTIATIASHVTHTVQPGSDHYGTHLTITSTITSTGSIDPANIGASGIRITSNLLHAFVLNDGTIQGAVGSTGSDNEGGAGIVNAGTREGGVAIYLVGKDHLIITGTIIGGAGSHFGAELFDFR